MGNILIVTGSVRPGSVNEKIVPIVVDTVESQGKTITVADLAELDLPFFNGPVSPGDPSFAPTDERVIRWTQLVADADGVILVTPEYNHTMSPVQLNAVDWIGKEWENKPVALIGYGWTTGGGQAHDTAREALSATLKATVSETQANLFFTKDINPDGSVIDQSSVDEKIGAAVRQLISIIS